MTETVRTWRKYTAVIQPQRGDTVRIHVREGYPRGGIHFEGTVTRRDGDRLRVTPAKGIEPPTKEWPLAEVQVLRARDPRGRRTLSRAERKVLQRKRWKTSKKAK